MRMVAVIMLLVKGSKCILSFNPHDKPLRGMLSSSPFYG